MAYGRKWKPSKSAVRDFAAKMTEIETFCNENGIVQSYNGDSYYFTINDKNYRVSNHTVESSNNAAYKRDQFGLTFQARDLYHPGGHEKDTIYIHAGKTRIIEIYNDLKAGYMLNGKGFRI